MERRIGAVGSGSGTSALTVLDPMAVSAVQLLAFDLLSVQHHAGSLGGSFTRKGRPVKKVETVGLVVSVDRRESYVSFKWFAVDDGTGCVPCILWTNHYKSSYFAHWKESEVELLAGIAETHAKNVRLGSLLRVMGRLSEFRNQLQITVMSLRNLQCFPFHMRRRTRTLKSSTGCSV